MKVDCLVQYVMSWRISDEEKSSLLKAVMERDDWEIVPWGYMDEHTIANPYEITYRGQERSKVSVRTRDRQFEISNVPIGYLTKEMLLEYIEELQAKY